MSIKMMTAVWDRFPNGGGEMLLALALADHAHDDGTNIYPGVKSLTVKTRQSERTVQYQLRAMVDAGWLVLVNEGHGGRGAHSEYRISPEWIKGADFASIKRVQSDVEKGAIHDKKGCNGLHPLYNQQEPSVNRQAAKRASRLAADWQLPKAYGEWAKQEFPLWSDDHIRKVALMFKNHWTAKAGKDAAKLDWFATWQNWCLKEPADPEGRSGGGSLPWYTNDQTILAKGTELGLAPNAGESMQQFKARINDKIDGRAPAAPAASAVTIPQEPTRVAMTPEAIAARQSALAEAKNNLRRGSPA